MEIWNDNTSHQIETHQGIKLENESSLQFRFIFVKTRMYVLLDFSPFWYIHVSLLVIHVSNHIIQRNKHRTIQLLWDLRDLARWWNSVFAFLDTKCCEVYVFVTPLTSNSNPLLEMLFSSLKIQEYSLKILVFIY